MWSITETSVSWKTGGGGPGYDPQQTGLMELEWERKCWQRAKWKQSQKKETGREINGLCKCCSTTSAAAFAEHLQSCLEHSNLGLLLYLHPHPWYEHRLERSLERQRLSSPCIFASVLRSALVLKSGICHILATLPHSLVSLLCWPQKKPGRTVIWSQASQHNWWLM